MNLERAFEKVDAAAGAGLLDVAYVFAVQVLVATRRNIAAKSGIKVANKTSDRLSDELGFRGVLPEDMPEASLNALSVRDSIVHVSGEMVGISVKDLLRLCDQTHQLT